MFRPAAWVLAVLLLTSPAVSAQRAPLPAVLRPVVVIAGTTGAVAVTQVENGRGDRWVRIAVRQDSTADWAGVPGIYVGADAAQEFVRALRRFVADSARPLGPDPSAHYPHLRDELIPEVVNLLVYGPADATDGRVIGLLTRTHFRGAAREALVLLSPRDALRVGAAVEAATGGGGDGAESDP